MERRNLSKPNMQGTLLKASRGQLGHYLPRERLRRRRRQYVTRAGRGRADSSLSRRNQIMKAAGKIGGAR